MTTVEKAKAYDRAIEKAKTLYNSVFVNNDVLEQIFPELEECEDERARKGLIHHLKELRSWKVGMMIPIKVPAHYDAWIAYLERQKEQKHSLNFDAISSWLRGHASRYVNSEFNEFHHCTEYDGTINVERLIADLKVAVDGGTFDVDAAFDAREPKDNWEYIKEFCNKFGRIPKDMDELDALVSYVIVKKQKEQKPAEWSEKDNAAHIRILGAVGKAFMGVLPTKPSEEDVRWLKTLPERFNLQPKQEQSEEEKERIRQNGRLDVCYNPEKYGLCHKTEWSEEEMKMLVSIIDDYETAAKSFCGHDGKIMFLKAIRDGEYGLSKQEWSEEDKRKLNRIYEILGMAADTHAYSTTCRLIGNKEAIELQDFLCSIAKPLTDPGAAMERNKF